MVAARHKLTPLAHTAIAPIARLYRFERDAKELIGPDRLESEQAWLAWHRQRWALRQQHSCPLLAEFRQWLEATEQTVPPKSPVGQALQYVLPRWPATARTGGSASTITSASGWSDPWRLAARITCSWAATMAEALRRF